MSDLLPGRLPKLTRRCVYHVVSVLHGSYAADQQATLIRQLAAYFVEMESACGCTSHEGIVMSSDLQRFGDGGMSVKEFCTLLEEALPRRARGHLNLEAMHDVCFKFYIAEMKKDKISWNVESLSLTCVYRLWLIFNVLMGGEGLVVHKDNIRDFMKRLFKLSGLNGTTDPEELSTIKDCLTFFEYLQIITTQFARHRLQMPLTCEMIEDLYDEFVCGVLMKGYLVKKGHVIRNYKRRWFILRSTMLTYYESKHVLNKKGEIILAKGTQVEDIPDTKKHTCVFKIFCVVSEKPFFLIADTQKTKHEWMTAINKILVLSKAAKHKGNEDHCFEQSTQHLYTLKYGSSLISHPKILDHYEGLSTDDPASDDIDEKLPLPPTKVQLPMDVGDGIRQVSGTTEEPCVRTESPSSDTSDYTYPDIVPQFVTK